MKIRIKFTKTGNMRFLGHLDVMRYFQKLMRRAGVDIRYSEGFSPHQIMSFAQPLGLGDTSEGEYVDIEVYSTGSSQEMIDRINRCSCQEIKVRRFVRIADETRRSNAMSNVAAADYLILSRTKPLEEEKLTAFLSQPSIPVLRKTKTREAEIDIAPMILGWQPHEKGLLVRLATGSAANCKPDTLMEAYERFCGDEPEPFRFHFHRLEMYARREERLIPLCELGEEIEPS
ncbi:MAG: DUF2344 domain-containing protein [Lachnospiraceae bacterium]|nr:DUF2344 domain-containing protein [Lachnospiraceae bacterium]